MFKKLCEADVKHLLSPIDKAIAKLTEAEAKELVKGFLGLISHPQVPLELLISEVPISLDREYKSAMSKALEFCFKEIPDEIRK